jgi:ribonuclease HIII
LPAAALDFDNHATNIAQHGSLSTANFKKSSFPENHGEQTIFGSDDREAGIGKIFAPAVIACCSVMLMVLCSAA